MKQLLKFYALVSFIICVSSASDIAQLETALQDYANNPGPFRKSVSKIYNLDSKNKRYCFSGDNDFLFPLYDLEFLIEPKPKHINEATKSIIAFEKYLDQRGIELLVVLIPNKGQLLHDELSLESPGSTGPAPWSRAVSDFLKSEGINTLHLFDPLNKALKTSSRPQNLYLLEDVHWGPMAIEVAAEVIGHELNKNYPHYKKTDGSNLKIQQIDIPFKGVCMNWLPNDHPRHNRPLQNSLTLNSVIMENGNPYRGDPASTILFAGDSFTDMFYQNGGSIDAHLSLAIGQRVSRLYIRGGGAAIPRVVQREAERYLEGKELVIWMFVDRYLNARNWAPIQFESK